MLIFTHKGQSFNTKTLEGQETVFHSVIDFKDPEPRLVSREGTDKRTVVKRAENLVFF